MEQLSGREYLILGSAGVDKLLEIIGTEDDMDMVTVSGWVTEIFERIPIGSPGRQDQGHRR